MFRRRRPLARAAAVGAAGYAVGKRRERRREQDAYSEDDEQVDSGALTEEQIESLRQLAQLKEEGILTNDEFEAQKEKILQGG